MPCTWSRCPASAEVSVDFWLFLGRIDYCRPHAEALMAELRKLGATRPFILGTPRGTRRVADRPLAAELLRVAS